MITVLSRLQSSHILLAGHLWAAIAIGGLCKSIEKGFLPNCWLFLGPKYKVLHENSSFSFYPASWSHTPISQCTVVRDRCHDSPQWSCLQITSHTTLPSSFHPSHSHQMPLGRSVMQTNPQRIPDWPIQQITQFSLRGVQLCPAVPGLPVCPECRVGLISREKRDA